MKPLRNSYWLVLALLFIFVVSGSIQTAWAAGKTKEQKAEAKVRKQHEAAQKKLDKCMENLVKEGRKCEKKGEDAYEPCRVRAVEKYENCKAKIIGSVDSKNAAIQNKRDKARHKCGSIWAKCFKKCKGDQDCKDDCNEEREDCVDKIDNLYPFIEKPHDSDDD